MDKPTLDYYALHASEVAQRYEVAPSPLAWSNALNQRCNNGSKWISVEMYPILLVVKDNRNTFLSKFLEQMHLFELQPVFAHSK